MQPQRHVPVPVSGAVSRLSSLFSSLDVAMLEQQLSELRRFQYNSLTEQVGTVTSISLLRCS